MTEQNAIILTESASFAVKDVLKSQNLEDGYLRVSVTGGGCTGLTYQMSGDEQPSDDDIILEYYGVKVLVKKSDAPVLNGTIIDFKESMMGGGFTIDNPNAIASCGCGTSFRTKDVVGTPEDC
ncbi:HesB/IscA family protein [Abyssicoccus albus]|uniref:HesB/IscA family protein n=1 Tax=Abyssicoccus albus TaxID=1817405 RepID=UPI00097E3129|nr:iron-sulfur cluster assembly accessory protein [Abyssicoccus albus]AQL56620.1 iron-sulfur cluster assembly accessory protein [Abyssicoccus albus]